MPAPFPHHHRDHSLLSSAPRATGGEEHTMATATTTAQVCRNFINGRWVESRSGRTVERRNPANLDEIIGLAPLSTREETREAIAPWNFPVSIPVWKISPALVAGNTVVFKPATLTPFTGAKVVEIFEQAGVPAGVLNMVVGSGGEVGDELLQHPDVRAVSFTGSNEVGSELYAQGARRMKKCQCEMGGKNPLVILADADLPLAVESSVFGAFASTGQRCTATSRDRKSTRLNSSHSQISYAVFCLKKKKK